MDKQELLKLLPEVIHKLIGSKEVIEHTIKVNTDVNGAHVVEASNVAMEALLSQWFDEEMVEEHGQKLLEALNAAFIAGTLYGSEIRKRKEHD